MASRHGEEEKLTQKIESIHTYSKRRGPRGHRGPSSKRPNNEIHSYAKSPASGTDSRSDLSDTEDIKPDGSTTEPKIVTLPSDALIHVPDGQRAFIKNQLLRQRQRSGNISDSFWQEMCSLFNRRFRSNVTTTWLEKVALQISQEESFTPIIGQEAIVLPVLEAATAPLEEVACSTCQHCSDSTASMAASVSSRPGHPDSDHSYYGLPAYPESLEDISPNITIEESHRLLQAVLTLSTSQIAQAALDIPSLRSALAQRLMLDNTS